MSNLTSLIDRSEPEPWAEGDNIPWNEEGFSGRMLEEHLSQEHDMASRRSATIDAHVDWIHGELLGGRPSRVLDLGCGPGLYCERLARLGHECRGIDYSPASIRHARREASNLGEGVTAPIYELGDLREADYGGPYDLVMQIFGELNVFKSSDAALILGKARRALAPGGAILLELHSYATVEAMGRGSPSWEASAKGLFSPEPHLLLVERHWDEARSAATIRYDLVDARSAEVRSYAQSIQAWTDSGYASLLKEAGFAEPRFLPGFGPAPRTEGLFVLCALTAAPLPPLPGRE